MSMAQDQEQAPKPVKQLDHRYEGIAKVTGKARYAAEFSEPFSKTELAYAFIVQATIPNGSVKSIDTAMASRASGVLAVITPFNAPKLSSGPRSRRLAGTSRCCRTRPFPTMVSRSR
jgi:xanthine dehydrogenase YagR molybdenum-binding subunit